jgi:hypothetical protein
MFRTSACLIQDEAGTRLDPVHLTRARGTHLSCSSDEIAERCILRESVAAINFDAIAGFLQPLKNPEASPGINESVVGGQVLFQKLF